MRHSLPVESSSPGPPFVSLLLDLSSLVPASSAPSPSLPLLALPAPCSPAWLSHVLRLTKLSSQDSEFLGWWKVTSFYLQFLPQSCLCLLPVRPEHRVKLRKRDLWVKTNHSLGTRETKSKKNAKEVEPSKRNGSKRSEFLAVNWYLSCSTTLVPSSAGGSGLSSLP